MNKTTVKIEPRVTAIPTKKRIWIKSQSKLGEVTPDLFKFPGKSDSLTKSIFNRSWIVTLYPKIQLRVSGLNKENSIVYFTYLI